MLKVLIVGYVWPEPNSSAAGSRMMQLINFFVSEKHEVVFATTAAPTPHMVNLEEFNVGIQTIELNNSSFDEFLSNFQPEIVLFDRFMMEEQFGWRVSEICPAALKILDTEDLHFLRKARQEAFLKNEKMSRALLQSDTAKREIASIYRCDISLIISEAEMNILIQDFMVPEALLFHLPFCIDAPTPEEISALPNFENRKHFISIGNFRHAPNWDAVLFLKQKIWPIISKKLPNAQLHVYGAYPPPKAMQLHNEKERFLVKGWAPNAKEVIQQAKVLLAPLRFGAGLKGKLLDAMLNGTPSVTTSIGAEAMHGSFSWNGFIENTEEEFSEKAVELYANEEVWNTSAENGFRILDKFFSKQKNEAALKEKITETVIHLKEHRINNFTGSMLQHHHNASTRYLSKFIEFKNKWEKLQEKS